MKTSEQYLAEANAIVPRISSEEAVTHWDDEDAVFIDVRDSKALKASATIKNSLHIPRGVMEFVADTTTSMYNPALTPDKTLYLVCGGGFTAALAGKTLKEMGYDKVVNIGGMTGWIAAKGAVTPGDQL